MCWQPLAACLAARQLLRTLALRDPSRVASLQQQQARRVARCDRSFSAGPWHLWPSLLIKFSGWQTAQTTDSGSLSIDGLCLYGCWQCVRRADSHSASQVVREKVFARLREEVPYEVQLAPVGFELRRDGSYLIEQDVLVPTKNVRLLFPAPLPLHQ